VLSEEYGWARQRGPASQEVLVVAILCMHSTFPLFSTTLDALGVSVVIVRAAKTPESVAAFPCARSAFAVQ
jgi:hypothetical protein